jgi:hypothetical protein
MSFTEREKVAEITPPVLDAETV